jgi:hypothetical protein
MMRSELRQALEEVEFGQAVLSEHGTDDDPLSELELAELVAEIATHQLRASALLVADATTGLEVVKYLIGDGDNMWTDSAVCPDTVPDWLHRYR